MNCSEIFSAFYPGFFRQEGIRALPETRVFVEMVMDLSGPLPAAVSQPLPVPSEITFGEYRGEIAVLREAVNLVDENWVQYFNENDRFFCAFDGGKIASFCILDEMGRVQGLRIGGPGCVGTVPAYRRQGIGLEMVRRATVVLQQEGFDLSWIHYTHLERWYGKLGYRTVLKWNCKGICE